MRLHPIFKPILTNANLLVNAVAKCYRVATITYLPKRPDLSSKGSPAPRVLDLFCGGGGSSFGAREAGCEIAGGIDLDAHAISVFRRNFPRAITWNAKIEDVDPYEVARAIGAVDVILASPECTHHSVAKGALPRDEGSKRTALSVLRYVEALEPKWVVIENVIQMRPWAGYSELIAGLRNLGYDISEHVLDSSNFGVPQKRRRLFVVCGRDQAPPAKIAAPKSKPRFARDILDPPGTWIAGPLQTQRRAKATLERAERAIASLGERTPFLLVYYGSDGSGGWQSLDAPIRTLTTLDRFGLVEPSDHGYTLRMLQVPELLRAMGFGARYKINVGTRRSQIRVLGNGVCPPVMKGIVAAINSLKETRQCQTLRRDLRACDDSRPSLTI